MPQWPKASAQRKQYSMYVWTTSFDVTISGCDEEEFLRWDKDTSSCFTHSWDTPTRKQWLWDTCNRSGREVSSIYMSGFKDILERAYIEGNCGDTALQAVRDVLQQGHTNVQGLEIYALFSASNIDVSERHFVPYVVWYNDNCAQNQSEKFDGVAVNNEAFASIKCEDEETVVYLSRLNEIAEAAKLQQSGILKVHYSIGWHWGRNCDDTTQDNSVLWNGIFQKVTRHMIDIFDSVDAQVAFVTSTEIANRAEIADYEYALQHGKPFYLTVYTNKVSACTTSFFPSPCNWGDKTEANMLAVFDELESPLLGVSQAIPCIHYFRGIYSSGGNPDWPLHTNAVIPGARNNRY
ncbi:unnamed protein product [Owenia fusiformis]|uniref:Uncharacterized protein n=1 Tax=Owenia fusiformis TaxID=6347 RepID=A0A8S4N4K0_OWEFU|nr:unnamed protein product [Owenia fusiformis]